MARKMDGMTIRECKISVQIAKYEREKPNNDVRHKKYQRKPERVHKPAWRDERTYKDVTNCNMDNGAKRKSDRNDGSGGSHYQEEDQHKTIAVEGKVCETKVEWLNRSLIGEGQKPLSALEVSSRLDEQGVRHEKVRAMDPYTVVITFKTKEEMEDALTVSSEEMLKIVDDIRKWSSKEKCRVRRVWIECIGVPIHGWSLENFEKIGEVWGKFIKCDLTTLNNEDFRMARIQIDTTVFQKITTSLCFMVGGESFDVFISEADGSSMYRDVQVFSNGEHYQENEALVFKSKLVQRRMKVNQDMNDEHIAGSETQWVEEDEQTPVLHGKETNRRQKEVNQSNHGDFQSKNYDEEAADSRLLRVSRIQTLNSQSVQVVDETAYEYGRQILIPNKMGLKEGGLELNSNGEEMMLMGLECNQPTPSFSEDVSYPPGFGPDLDVDCNEYGLSQNQSEEIVKESVLLG